MSKPWMISVLSTAYDLSDYREAIISMLKEKGFEVSAYELPEFPVEYNKHSHDSCLIALDRVDIAIVIIDKRSGGVYCGIENDKKGFPITEAEYLEAIKRGIPVFFCIREKTYDEYHEYKKDFVKYCLEHRLSKKAKKAAKNLTVGIIANMLKKCKRFTLLKIFKMHIQINKQVTGCFFSTALMT